MSVASYNRRNLREVPECHTDPEELDISCNFVSAVPVGRLAAYQLLRRLYLSCNELTEVPNFGHISKQLEVLHLNNNKIESIGNMENLTRLKELNLRGNRITELGSLLNNTQIEWLSLSSNAISHIRIDQLGCCQTLRFLGLFGNQLSSLPEVLSLFKVCLGLKEATVGGNPFCGGLQLSLSLSQSDPRPTTAVSCKSRQTGSDVPSEENRHCLAIVGIKLYCRRKLLESRPGITWIDMDKVDHKEIDQCL